MGQVSSKLRSVTGGFSHWCPGCERMHVLPHPRGWTFNGDLERPTFSPSFRHDWRDAGGERVCHYFLQDGKLQFCGDAWHGLAGQTVELPALPAWLVDI